MLLKQTLSPAPNRSDFSLHFVPRRLVGDHRIAKAVPVSSAVMKPAMIMQIVSSGS